MIDREIVTTRLASLARCITRIEEHRPEKLEGLVEDYDTQDIVSVNLQRAVQLCVDVGSHILAEIGESVPPTMVEVFSLLGARKVIGAGLARDLVRAVGFRNISVHEYDSIDWKIVFEIIHDHLGEFRDFASAVMEHLGRPS